MMEGDSMMGMKFTLGDIARQELCSALVRRLEIAENQIRELEDMLELDRKA